MENEVSMPLVSIVVITYNSEEFIIEALDSIKAQTYQNIELIISDDCSKDSTVSLCQEWIEKNKSRFIDSKLLTVEQNTGITGNINRGCREARGEWIKPLAGDDVLMETCIENNLENCLGKNIIFSRIEKFLDNGILGYLPSEKDKYFFKLSAREQFKILFRGNVLPAPSSFVRRSFLKDQGFFDEKYPTVEDIPLWLKITYGGEKVYYFDEVTVRYRIHAKQVSHTMDVIFNLNGFNVQKKLYLAYYDSKGVTRCMKLNKFFQFYISEKTISSGNTFNEFNKYRLIDFMNPCKYFFKIQQLMRNSQ